MIPQTDPKASYLAHQPAIDAAVRRVLHSGWYILGKELRAFEEEFARYVGVGHGIGVANGTDAIELSLRACGVGPGDVVFTVSHTAVATVVGVERSGAIPALVDIDPATYTMCPRSLEQAVVGIRHGTPKAVVVVHLYGQPADMGGILDIARRRQLVVIEDCAQAHGATWRGRRVGALGDAAAFSFYPTKNLGALGDGGMVVTNRADAAERCRMLREYGWRQRYISDVPGVNSRLDELQAAILHAKLEHLDADNARRAALAGSYDAALAGSRVARPIVRPHGTHVYHQYVIRTPAREALRQHLRSHEIGTLVHYPVPVHLQPAYRGRLAQPVSLAETEKAAMEVLSLPMYAELQHAQAEAVAEAIHLWERQESATH